MHVISDYQAFQEEERAPVGPFAADASKVQTVKRSALSIREEIVRKNGEL